VAALRKIGCTVYVIGRPVDIVVGLRARNWLIDCKSKSGVLTPDQEKFFAAWKGQVCIVRSPEDAIRVVRESYRR